MAVVLEQIISVLSYVRYDFPGLHLSEAGSDDVPSLVWHFLYARSGFGLLPSHEFA